MYREFEEYVFNNYDMKNPKIYGKYYHSKRVAIMSKKIAQELNFSYHDVLLATQIGLLHDIARFYEYKKYKSYNIKNNFDHGLYAVYLLKKDNFVRKFNINTADEDILYAAIFNHNKYAIENKYANNKFCKLIRDADKADILYRISSSEKFESNFKGMNISIKVNNAFNNQSPIDSANVKTYADYVLFILGFIFDLNYKETIKIIYKRNYLDNLYNLLDNKSQFKKYFNEVIIYMEKRLKDVRA